jgi:hypothetical protein
MTFHETDAKKVEPHYQPWSPLSLWISEDGKMNNRHFNPVQKNLATGRSRFPVLVEDRFMVNYTHSQKKKRVPLLQALAFAHCPYPTGGATPERKNEEVGDVASNIVFKVKGRRLRRSISFHPSSSQGWKRAMYAEYDTSGRLCVKRELPMICTKHGVFRLADGSSTIGDLDALGKRRIHDEFGWVYVERILFFTFEGIPTRDFCVDNARVFPRRDDDCSLPHLIETSSSTPRHAATWSKLMSSVSTLPLYKIPPSFWVDIAGKEVLRKVCALFNSQSESHLLWGSLSDLAIHVEKEVGTDSSRETLFGRLRLLRLYLLRLHLYSSVRATISWKEEYIGSSLRIFKTAFREDCVPVQLTGVSVVLCERVEHVALQQ